MPVGRRKMEKLFSDIKTMQKLMRKANFTIFSENPIKANALKLNEIEIWGTVFEGEAFQIKKKTNGMGMIPNSLIDYSKLVEHSESCEKEHHTDACMVNQILQAHAMMLQQERIKE